MGGDEMQNAVDDMDIMNINPKELWDIDEVDIDMTKSIEERTLDFMEQTGGGYRTHRNGDYIVRVHFSDTEYTATDAIKHYLKQIAELKY